MYITKLGHSCVLVETEDRIGLFDPGAWADKSLVNAVEHVDRIIYTHEHADHFDVDILKSLVSKFPKAHIVCHDSMKAKIIEAGIQSLTRGETECTRQFDSSHEQLPVPGAVAPVENGYHFKDVFTHPGDSQSFAETKKVLAMPFIGPWGKTGDSIKKVLELKPEYVMPIHDWHYTEEAKQWLQGILDISFKDSGIKVMPNKNGLRIRIED